MESTVYLTSITNGNHIVEFSYPDYTDKQLGTIIKNDITSIKSEYEVNPLFNLNILVDGVEVVSIYTNNSFIGKAPLSKSLPVADDLISFKAPHIEGKDIYIEPKQGSL